MGVPLSQMWTVASYVLRQKLAGRKRYPLVLMLEPLFRCNLACAGCGKIQFPADVLRRHLSPEQCFAAADECGAPIVSIPGGRRVPIFDARWVAWSPDGSQVATATEQGIVLRRWPDGQELARIPVDAADVSWSRGP